MDVARLEQLRYDLLHGEILKHRRLLVGVSIFLVAFWTLTIAGGYMLVTHAMNDDQIASQRAINTPTQVALLFDGHRPYDLVNSVVFLNRVKLEPATASHVYYAGDDSGPRLLVVDYATGAPADPSVANIFGTVRPLNAGLMKKWKLSKAEQKTLKTQGVYLEAQSVKVQKDSTTLARK